MLRSQGRRLKRPQNRLNQIQLLRLNITNINCWGNAAFLRVPLHMFRQMIRSHELPFANLANELLLAGVRPLVSGELIRPGESSPATFPLADERSFAGVRANVRLQVGTLEVVLITTRMLAFVDPSAFRGCIHRGWGLRHEYEMEGGTAVGCNQECWGW